MRVEVRPALKRGQWAAWNERGDMIMCASLINAMRTGIALARAARCELWLFERRYENGESGSMIGDFSNE